MKNTCGFHGSSNCSRCRRFEVTVGRLDTADIAKLDRAVFVFLGLARTSSR